MIIAGGQKRFCMAGNPSTCTKRCRLIVNYRGGHMTTWLNQQKKIQQAHRWILLSPSMRPTKPIDTLLPSLLIGSERL
jgi:hypothetical protein